MGARDNPRDKLAKTASRRLILLLGDQLSVSVSSLRAADPAADVVLMCEVMAEAKYVGHHKKKIALIFSAMRHFAEELRELGFSVIYRPLSAEDNRGNFEDEVARALSIAGPFTGLMVTEPGEWRLLAIFETWEKRFGLPVAILPDDRFLCSRAQFAAWAEGRKQLRMEYFYRDMRRQTGLLMNGAEPEGGLWNFDAENRKPPKAGLRFADPPKFSPDAITQDVLALVASRFGGHFGDLEPFWFAVNREQALAAMRAFMVHGLPHFGDYQDAMLVGEKFLYHALLSAYINCGLLLPLEVVTAAEAEYRAGRVPLNAAEGFIRQIIGWREYVRGIYWLRGPGYAHENYFGHDRPLPEFYWTAETNMACIAAAIRQTKEEAYAHHIQRLMVTGNFALLAGIDPHAVHEWYLAVYADAYEWVELPNTLGMSQFADGGVLGSKPYAASGNYINKMSNYCKSCRYDVKTRVGANACPFNALYWDFIARNANRLKSNPRMAQIYRTWEKMSHADRQSTRWQAAEFLAGLDAKSREVVAG